MVSVRICVWRKHAGVGHERDVLVDAAQPRVSPLSTPPKRSRLAAIGRVADVEILREPRLRLEHDGHAADDDEVDPAVDQAGQERGGPEVSPARHGARAGEHQHAGFVGHRLELAEALRRRQLELLDG